MSNSDSMVALVLDPVAEEMDREQEQIKRRGKELAENTLKDSYSLQNKMQLECQYAYEKFVAVENECNQLIIRNLKNILHVLKSVEIGMKSSENRYGDMFDEEKIQTWIVRMNDFNKLIQKH